AAPCSGARAIHPFARLGCWCLTCLGCCRDRQFKERSCLVLEAQHPQISAPGGDCSLSQACPSASAHAGLRGARAQSARRHAVYGCRRNGGCGSRGTNKKHHRSQRRCRFAPPVRQRL
ncbi:MAG: hypothetical protein ACK55Z_24060, partial [bacterium]